MRYLIPFALAASISCATIASAERIANAPRQGAYATFDKAVADAKAAMMGDPQQALAKSNIAAGLAKALPASRDAQIAAATAAWLRAESLIMVNRAVEAKTTVATALATIARVDPNSKLEGDLMRSRGGISAIQGNVMSALEDYQRAFRIFGAAKVPRSQSIVLQDIGQIYWDSGDYKKALQYYLQSAETYSGEPGLTLGAHNNQGEVLRKLGRYGDAEREYRLALIAAKQIDSDLLTVRILTNIAIAQVENGEAVAAEQTVRRALALSNGGEAASWRPFIFGVEAKIANARGQYPRAASLLRQAFAGADFKTTQLPFKEFHELGAAVFEKLGQQDRALAHLKAFQRLDSEARNLTASASSQLMGARFDFANQNLKISQLKQGQLQRDIAIERQKSEFRTIVLGGLIGAGGIVFGLLLFGYVSIRRSRNQVRDANDVLTTVNTRLEKALKAKTDFLAMTSHEIRTPLNGILGMTQILLTNKRIDTEVREQVEVVHGAGEAMRVLVDDILDVAKMETGETSVVSEVTDFHRILEDSVRLWQGQATGRGLGLSMDLGDTPKMIMSDGARVRQIIFNLLSNAIKFTPSGMVALTVVTSTSADSGMLELAIADTGIGIPPDQLEAIFEPFHQVDGGTTRQFGGTGLGLAICRNLARALGGDVSVVSTVDHGSTFTLRIPLLAAGEGGQSRPGVGDAPVLLSEVRLLLLEANGITQGVLRSVFEGSVRSFDCVDSAERALEILSIGGCDHLLVEGKSTCFRERDALDSLRGLVGSASIKGIASTVLFAPSEALPERDVAMIGASQIVLKPVGAVQLLAAMTDFYRADETPDVSVNRLFTSAA